MRNRRGFMLVFTLVIIVLVVLSLAALFLISYNDLGMATTESKGMKAYYIAEAGLAKKFMDLRSSNPPPDYTNITGASFSFSPAGGDSGTLNVTITPHSASPSYVMTSTGTYGNISRTVSMTVKQVSYSAYGYLSDSEDSYAWGSPIWFVTGDILSGPLHSNDQLNISGNPVFKGPVTSAQSTLNYYHGGPPQDNPQFQDSLTLGVPAIGMPSTSNALGQIKAAAQVTGPQGGLYYNDSDKQIVLKSAGTMDVYKKKNGNWVIQSSNIAIPANNALFVDGYNVYISGVMKGLLTVGTSNEIYITNSILYNTDPRTNPNSTDLLSLVAQNNVHVMNNAPTNVEIDAYIIAEGAPPNQPGSFEVDNYDTIAAKGTLTVYGGITQTTRGGVGTFDGVTNQKISGYTKNYNYDTRLVNSVPAYFPPAKDSSNRIMYKKVSWSET